MQNTEGPFSRLVHSRRFWVAIIDATASTIAYVAALITSSGMDAARAQVIMATVTALIGTWTAIAGAIVAVLTIDDTADRIIDHRERMAALPPSKDA